MKTLARNGFGRRSLMAIVSLIAVLLLLGTLMSGEKASAATAQDIPIDLLVDNGDGVTYINGPRDVAVGDTIKFSSTIDMSSIAAIAANFGNSIGYITGNFTITLTGSAGVAPSAGFGTSADIADYFAGGAMQMFELVSAPTYDAATNTITFNVKVKDSYADPATAITGAACAAIIGQGLSGNSNYTATIDSGIETSGYARAVATFSGTLNYRNAANTLNFTINMTGVQMDPANLADPTLATYGSDPATAVSTTVLYKPAATTTNPQTGDDSAVLFYGLLAAGAVALTVAAICFKKKGTVKDR